MFTKLKDPISALSHMVGAIAAIPVTIILIIHAVRLRSAWYITSFAIFGAALFLLYTASTVYHSLALPEKFSILLRRFDHIMIFILIAGTYTPVCLILLRGAWGYTLLALIWTFAIGGVALKLLWLDAPRFLSTVLYVLMGWLVVIAFYPLLHAASPGVVALLILGGVTYTLGAVIYAFKWPHIQSKLFGFHEIFHLFVLGGSAFHVAFMFCI